MALKSVYETFHLSSVIRDSSLHDLLLHPLELVVADSNQPRLIVTYDHSHKTRVDLGIPRIQNSPTHMNITVVPGLGEAPTCASFGAACAIETLQNGEFRKVNPHLRQQEAAIFGPWKHLAPFQMMNLRAYLEYAVPGQVINEDARHGDSFASVALKKDSQIRAALEVIQEWKLNPPKYALYGEDGKNCKNFDTAVLEKAEVHKPVWWGITDWPAFDAGLIEFFCDKKLRISGGWLLQPTEVTRVMAIAAHAAHKQCTL